MKKYLLEHKFMPMVNQLFPSFCLVILWNLVCHGDYNPAYINLLIPRIGQLKIQGRKIKKEDYMQLAYVALGLKIECPTVFQKLIEDIDIDDVLNNASTIDTLYNKNKKTNLSYSNTFTE